MRNALSFRGSPTSRRRGWPLRGVPLLLSTGRICSCGALRAVRSSRWKGNDKKPRMKVRTRDGLQQRPLGLAVCTGISRDLSPPISLMFCDITRDLSPPFSLTFWDAKTASIARRLCRERLFTTQPTKPCHERVVNSPRGGRDDTLGTYHVSTKPSRISDTLLDGCRNHFASRDNPSLLHEATFDQLGFCSEWSDQVPGNRSAPNKPPHSSCDAAS